MTKEQILQDANEGTKGPSLSTAGLGAWSPIETAPKDGTSILAWSPEYGQRQTRMSKYGKGSPGFAEWERGDGPLNSGWEWYEPRSGWISSWSPAYWMPLPEAPNVQGDRLRATHLQEGDKA